MGGGLTKMKQAFEVFYTQTLIEGNIVIINISTKKVMMR